MILLITLIIKPKMIFRYFQYWIGIITIIIISFGILGILDNQYGLCSPILQVDYNREYFKKDDVRISIDNNINYQLFGENIHKKDESSIVEIKTSIKETRIN